MRRWALGRVAVLGVVTCCFILSGAQAQTAAQKTYSANARGLEQQMKEFYELARRGELKELESRAEQFVLPDHYAWFEKTFGEELARPLTLEYASGRDDIPKRMALTIHDLVQRGLKEIQANAFKSGCRPLPTDEQYRLLTLRQTPEPLYDVRFLDSGMRSGQGLWFFAHVDGAFRYVGVLTMPTEETGPPVDLPAKRGRRKSQIRPIKEIRPDYPPELSGKRIEGIVRLRAFVSMEGDVTSAYVVEGHCYFGESALKAVRKWRYPPLTVEGEPVEAIVTITITFKVW